MQKLILLLLSGFLIITSASGHIIKGTYAIQCTTTGKNLRPYEAGSHNGNRIVLYDHIEWKCMTWNFLHVEGSTYQLKNIYTSKTFQPVESPAKNGSLLQQQPILNYIMQQWEFIKTEDNSYNVLSYRTRMYKKTQDKLSFRDNNKDDSQLNLATVL